MLDTNIVTHIHKQRQNLSTFGIFQSESIMLRHLHVAVESDIDCDLIRIF